jgi:hypothetical protein
MRSRPEPEPEPDPASAGGPASREPTVGAPIPPTSSGRAYAITRTLESDEAFEVLLARGSDPNALARPVVLRRLLRSGGVEARALARIARPYARLNHPALVRLFDFVATDGAPTIVFEHVEGVRLSEVCAQQKACGSRLPDLAIAYLAHRLFTALAAAHDAWDTKTGARAPLVHGRVSAKNIVVPPDGYAKLDGLGVGTVLEAIERARADGLSAAHAHPQAHDGAIGADIAAGCALLEELLTGESGERPPAVDFAFAASTRPSGRTRTAFVRTALLALAEAAIARSPAAFAPVLELAERATADAVSADAIAAAFAAAGSLDAGRRELAQALAEAGTARRDRTARAPHATATTHDEPADKLVSAQSLFSTPPPPVVESSLEALPQAIPPDARVPTLEPSAPSRTSPATAPPPPEGPPSPPPPAAFGGRAARSRASRLASRRASLGRVAVIVAACAAVASLGVLVALARLRREEPTSGDDGLGAASTRASDVGSDVRSDVGSDVRSLADAPSTPLASAAPHAANGSPDAGAGATAQDGSGSERSAIAEDAGAKASAPDDPNALPAGVVLGPRDGLIRTTKSAEGHRVFIDDRYVGEGEAYFRVTCGPHAVRVGSAGTTQRINVPCGGVARAGR